MTESTASSLNAQKKHSAALFHILYGLTSKSLYTNRIRYIIFNIEWISYWISNRVLA